MYHFSSRIPARIRGKNKEDTDEQPSTQKNFLPLKYNRFLITTCTFRRIAPRFVIHFFPSIPEVYMNKKFWIGFAVIFFVIAIFSFLIHGVLLMSTYEQDSMKMLWRAPNEMKMWLMYVVYLFIAFFLTLIFTKWYKGNGIVEGLQFGVYAGFLMSVPMAYGTYATTPITYALALQWFIYGFIEYVIIGIVLAMIFGKQGGDKKA